MYLEYLKLCPKLYRKLGIHLTHIPDLLIAVRGGLHKVAGLRAIVLHKVAGLRAIVVAQGCSAQLHVSQGMGF